MSTSRYVIPDLDDDDDQQQKNKDSRLYFSKRTKTDHPAADELPPPPPPPPVEAPVTIAPPPPAPAPVPAPPPVTSVATAASLLVHSRQRGNPLLKYFRQVKWEYSDAIPGGADYQMGRSSCALYLSLRYYTLNPNYIYDRLKTSKFPHQLKILLVQCSVGEASQSLKELARLCLLYELTLLLSWTDEESAKYLETYKIMEGKSAENLPDTQQIQSNDFLSKYIDTMTQVRLDLQLFANPLSSCSSAGQIDQQKRRTNLAARLRLVRSDCQCTNDQLSVCPGLGKLKAQRLFQAFHQPFLRAKPKKSSTSSSSTSTSTSTTKKPTTQKLKRSDDPEEGFRDLSNIDEEI